MNSQVEKARNVRTLTEAELTHVTGGAGDMIPLRGSRVLDEAGRDIIPLLDSVVVD